MRNRLSKIKRAIYLLFQFSWAGYLREERKCRRGNALHSPLELEKVKQYYDANIASDKTPRTARTILVEMIAEHPAANFCACLVQMLLAKKFQVRSFALNEYGDANQVRTMAGAFGIMHFLGIYKFLDFRNHLAALFGAIHYALTARYDVNQGISLEIDGQEIGSLVYDEYVRLTSEPTTRQIDFVYWALIYNSIYRYRRYKEIIRNSGATDIIMTHNVYGKFGLVIKAAAAVSDSISIWNTMNIKPISINRALANKQHIDEPLYYTKEYEQIIRRSKSIGEIEEEFRIAFERRMGAKDVNVDQIEVVFVYANNAINTVREFLESYKTDSRKKIFIMAHAFVDAVRYPLWQSYSDNYVWLRETLLLLAARSAREEIYVKPHPCESLYNCNVSAEDLVKEVNRLHGARFVYLDKKVHNGVIFKLAKALVTSHGTVGIEAPCLGVPVIAASSCQFEEAGTIFQARNAKEYAALLDGVDKLPPLNGDQIMSAKIAFLWFNQYAFVDSEILADLSMYEGEGRVAEYGKIDRAFASARPIEQQQVYKAFCQMFDRGHNELLTCGAELH